jgi:hypothetical protein
MRRNLILSVILLAGAAMPAFAQCDTSIRVVNRSNAVVNELYFNPTRLSNWGPDRLGANVLASGASSNYRPSPGGNYDFKAVFANGREVERRNVNLCEVSTVTISGNGISAE